MPDKLILKIAKDIKEARQGLDLTQAEFATLFNHSEPLGLQTSRVDICKYETGKMACPATKYLKFLLISDRPD